MNKKINELFLKLASFLFIVTTLSVNTTCMFFMNQPKLPTSAEKFKRI